MPRHPFRSALLLVLAATAAPLLIACGGDDDDDPPSSATTSGSPAPTAASTRPPLEGEILIFAASSLTNAFEEAGISFEAANPRTKVTFNFASSSALATQINEGAPADVFASADTNQMKVVSDKGNAGEPRVFVKNLPVVVVPKGSSAVATFADLAKPGLNLVLAAPEVPIGRYSRDIFAKASEAQSGISADFSQQALANLKSNEANVRAVLTKVQLGEADAGIVYTTDVAAAGGEVSAIDIPQQYNVIAEYPIAVIKASKERGVAEAFVEFILSPGGQEILEKHGFSAP
ncbi:MAG: molybdate ABC transporter substrate-binding protein [Dehalococcoidia bacterium]